MADVEFVNQALAALTNPRRGFAVYEKTKQGEYQVRTQQRRLVEATKFTVSDSLLAHAVKAMFVSPDKLLAACQLAVPPFENMWIEWDSHLQRELMAAEYEARGIEYGSVDREGGLSRAAYHIDVVKGLPCYNFFGVDDKSDDLYFTVHGVYLLNESVIAPSVMRSRRHVALAGYSDDREWDNAYLRQQDSWGVHLLSRHYVKLWADEPSYWPALTALYRRMAFGGHVLGQCMYPQLVEEQSKETAQKLLEATLNTISGDMRLMITLLALVNYPHHIIERKAEVGIPQISYGRRVPRNEVRVLEIDLPKPRGVKRYERMFKGGGGQKRQHVRRGHWRNYHHKDGRVTQRWIEEQTVGNPALGVIEHEYKLLTKGVK